MPDVTLPDIMKGVVDSWDAATAVKAIIATSKLYFGRQPENASLPYCVFEFKDVSAYFGGTEYFSGAKYVRATQITFKTYFQPVDFNIRDYATKLNDAFGWSSSSPAGGWTIPNATVLAAMPEVEAIDIEAERVDGKDVLTYESTFTVKMEADRG